MKRAAILLPAMYPDAPAPGEYVRSESGVYVACPECGVVEKCDPSLLWSCGNPACVAVSLWLELAGVN